MSKDLTKTLLLKRSTKKKSGYTVSEQENGYYLETAPSKARVNPGDRVVGINGIPADEFLDEEDANGLIESIRIVVVPKDKLDEYDGIHQGDDAVEDDEEEYEEYDRTSGIKNPLPAENTIYKCTHCGHLNEDLEPDEDGDLVCEECGHVMEPDIIRVCEHCDIETKNLERDDEGDLVCPECGHIIEEGNPESEDELKPRNSNAKKAYKCESCNHESVDPKRDKDGDYICENCGSALDVDDENEKTAAEKLKAINDDDSEASRGGQQFDDSGRPITNPEGKKLTPADMFSPGDVVTVTVGKSNPKQDPGLKVEENNGKYYVRKVPSGGLFARTPVIAGDKILELNGIDSHEFKNVNELKKILKDEPRITIVVLRRDPDASESSASSVDYDELRAIKPPVKGDDDTRETEDDDSVCYDGEDCGCTWCPHCHE